MRIRTVLSQSLVAILGVLIFISASLAQEDRPASQPPAQIDILSQLSIEELLEVKITSIATGTKKLISDAPSIASVLTAEEIQLMGAKTLEEALIAIPGMHVSVSTVTGSPKYLIRGINSTFNPQVLVLINGIPISSIVRGDRNGRMRVMPIKMISRIEVIRGPGSALYGADAFAGVINVITKNADDLKTAELGGQLGSFHTYDLWYLRGGQKDDWKWSVMLDYRQTQGHQREVSADAQSGLDQVFGTQASLAPGAANFEEKEWTTAFELERKKWRLRGIYHHMPNVSTGYGAAGALDPRAVVSRQRTNVDLTYRDPALMPKLDLTSTLSFMNGYQEYKSFLTIFPPGANLGNGVFANGVLGRPDYFERQFRFDNVFLSTALTDHHLQLGVGFTRQDLYEVRDTANFTPNFTPRPDLVDLSDTAEINLPETSRTNFYTFLQDEWNIAEDWVATAGIRMDQYSDFGSTYNPRAAVVWATTEKLKTKFLYGRAFRAPAFAELYTINNPISLGNPNVGPETIDVYELGWIYKQSPNWETSFNIFRYDIRDLITFVRNSNGAPTAQNSGKQNGKGFEFETMLKTSKYFYLTGNYSFVDSRDGANDKPTGNYPNDRVYVRGDWSFAENWSWSTQANWLGPRHREPNDTRSSLRGFTSVDMILRRNRLWKSLNLTASVQNILDADIREPSPGPGTPGGRPSVPDDLPQAGRAAMVEISYQF